MRSGAVVLGLFAGCGFHASGAPGVSDGPGGSGGGDGMPGGDGCVSFSSQVDTCRVTLDSELTLSGTITYDTGTHELRVNGTVTTVAHVTLAAKAGDVDAILAHDVRLTSGAGLRATGPLPLAIVASGSVTLDDSASIDVGSAGGGADPGAGAQHVCANSPVAGGANAFGAGGGGGGGYGAAGGAGGTGNNLTPSIGGAGAALIAMPPGPGGGCPGAAGGSVASGGTADGGPGGGALYIVAAGNIGLGNLAVLTAGGGGGRGGGQPGGSLGGGGGGGGSGGMIFLEALHITGQSSQIAANGGGGGGGGGTDALAPASDGNKGTTSTGRADGGSGGFPGGTDGGRGGSLAQSAGEEVTTHLVAGGGGGGGAVGYVHIKSDDVHLGSISPDPS